MKNSKSQPNHRPAFLQDTGNSMALPIMEFKAQIRQHNENCSKLNYSLALKIAAHFTGWGSFSTFSRFLGILGTPWNNPGGCGSVSRDMGGRAKKRCFSDFGLYPQVHREFQRAIFVNSFVFKCFNCFIV